MRFCGQCGNKLDDFVQEGHRRALCPSCGWVWFNNPAPVVLVFAVADDGNVLYTRRREWPPGVWGLVAGFVEEGERAEDAALREVREESGLEATDPVFVGTLPHSWRLLICFQVRLAAGNPRAGDDADAVDLAPPQPERIPPGAPARWLLERLQRQCGKKT